MTPPPLLGFQHLGNARLAADDIAGLGAEIPPPGQLDFRAASVFDVEIKNDLRISAPLDIKEIFDFRPA